jgi:hypothetical protein
MRNVFLLYIPPTNHEALVHYEDTIASSVDQGRVLSHLTRKEGDRLKRAFGDRSLKVWGSRDSSRNRSSFDKMSEGDDILIIAGKTIRFMGKGEFRRSLAALKPSLDESIRLAARRTVGPGVREGHDPKLVIALSGVVGRALADPLSKAKVGSDQDLMEGALKRVVSSRFERNAAARRACIAHHGTSCGICPFSFESIFGDLGVGFIHVHHVKPLAGLRRQYRVDPVHDLLPICPNCHAMIHRQDPPLDVDGLRRQIRSTS